MMMQSVILSVYPTRWKDIFAVLHAWKIDFNKKQKRYLLFEKKDHHHADMGDIRSLDAVCHGRPRVFDPAAQSHGMVGTSRRLL
jgi:hypothetical protein